MTGHDGRRTADAIRAVRADVAALHRQLVRYGLVVWTGGNVSGRVPGTDLFVIKPSGVEYDDLTPESMIVCDLGGVVLEGDSRRRATPRHTHTSTGICRRSAGSCTPTRRTPRRGRRAARPSRACITGQADEFGGEIPVGPFAIIGDESIGEGIVATLTGHRSRAVLMQNHGVFTIGRNARDAVKAAVMAEDVARTVHLARQLGEPIPIPPDKIDALFNRYQNVYGQHVSGEHQ